MISSRTVSATVAVFAGAVCLFAADVTAPLEKYTANERRHWAFVKRSQPKPPAFPLAADRAWTRNPIDAFILARLKKAGLRPSPPADRATLIRRVYFNLIGLPPSPREVMEFAADRSPDAYQNLVERLLASPQYGERWGQHWLDVARFAESDGFEYDTHRRDAWRYRDYVIRAFNEDRPYDRFLTEQLAGDETTPVEQMTPAGHEKLIAAGFNRLGPLRKNAGNQEVASSRNEVLTEMTNAVGSALLGVTLGCARCHDHMFDPLRQSDYYRLQAYFATTHEKDIVQASEAEQKMWKARAAPVEEELKKLRAELREATKGKKADEKERIARQIEAAQEKMPEALPALFSVVNDPAKRSPIHLLPRGDYQQKGARVGMRPLGVLLPEGAPELPDGASGPRTALAKWITGPDHPLTARVMVNRIWHHHFGRGIVSTPNDFGKMGTPPSHPELLDYLANEFVAGGFRVKQMHRLILHSNAYKQSSAPRNNPRKDAAVSNDPENRLLWRFNRRRLQAEEIRDAVLAVAGSLNPKQGGPSVIVPIDRELVNALYKPAQWAVTPDAAEHTRRSIYLIAKRNLRLPMMEAFDAPDLQLSCARRESSTHAPQALELLNGDLVNRQAEVLARRLEAEAGPDPRAQIDLAYRLAAGRPPTQQELHLALEFLQTHPQGSGIRQRPEARREFALAVFNLNAFLYVN